MTTLRHQAASSVKWVGGASFARAVATYCSLMLASRHMTAQEFGVFNIALLVMGYGQILAEGGLRDALIYRQDLTPALFSTVVWLSAAFSLGLVVVIWLSAGILAAAFHMPGLASYMPVIALGTGVLTLGGPFQALLEKNLEFRIQATLDVVGAVVLLVAVLVVLLVTGSGVEGLIAGNVAAALARTGLLMWAGQRRLAVLPVFRLQDARDVLSFGIFRTLEGVLLQSVRRMDQILIALVFGPAVVGSYAFAWQLVVDPVAQLNAIFNRVLFPSLAKLRPNLDRVGAAYVKGVRVIALVNSPVPIFASAAAALYVPLLFGHDWGLAIALMPFLAPLAVIRAVVNPAGSLMIAMGYPRRMLVWQAGVAAGTAVTMVPGLLLRNVWLVVTAVCVAYLTTFVCHVFVLIRTALPNFDVAGFFRWFLLPASAAALEYAGIAGVVQYAGTVPSFLTLVVAGAAGAVAYLAVYAVGDRALLQECVRLLLKGGMRPSPAPA